MYTIKRVDVVSAMKVGALFNALLFTVVGVLFFAFNSLFIGSLTSSLSTLGTQSSGSFNPQSFMMASVASCLVFYLMGIVFSALTGALMGALYAFFYNVISNWTGGLRVELAQDQVVMVEKTKHASDDTEFRF
jgi:uncharacterized membrane protein YdjX (TVP38/TMEM64 family)